MRGPWAWAWVCGALALAPILAGHYLVGTPPGVSRDLFAALWTGDLQLTSEMLVALPILGVFIWLFWSGSVVRIPAARVTYPVLLLWLWILFSMTQSQQRYASVLEASRWSLAIASFFVVAGMAGRGQFARALLVTLASAATLCAIKASWEYASVASDPMIGPGYRAFGTFYNPNFFAAFLVMSATLTMGLLAAAREGGRVLFGFLAAIQAFAILLTGSRFGLAAFAVTCLIFVGLLIWFGGPTRRAVPRLIVAGLVAVGLVGVFALRFHHTPGTRSLQGAAAQEHSGAFREMTWRGAVKMAEAKPLLGHGIGTFPFEYPRYALVGFTVLAHNSYLQLASETGWVGLGLLVLVAVAWLSLVLQRERHDLGGAVRPPRDPERPVEAMSSRRGRSGPGAHVPQAAQALLEDDPRTYRAAVVAAVIGLAIHCLLDSDLSIFATLILFWSLAGLALALSVDAVFPERIAPIARRALATVVGGVIGVHFALTGVAAVFGNAGTAVTQQITAGNADIASRVSAEHYLQTALALDPRNPEYHVQLGSLLLADPDTAQRALDQIRRAAALQPSARLYFKYGLALETYEERMRPSAPDFTAAIDAYRMALRKYPADVQTLTRIAGLELRAGKKDAAMETYGKIVAIESSPANQILATPEFVDTRYATAHIALARSDIERGSDAEAVENLKAASKVLSSYRAITRPLLRRYLGAGLTSLGGYDVGSDARAMQEYVETLRMLMRLDPGHRKRYQATIDDVLADGELLKR